MSKTAARTIRILRVGLALVAVKMSVDAAVALAAGKSGAGLFDAGLALVYALMARADLPRLWASRHMTMRQLMASDAQATSNWFRLAVFLSHCLIAAGLYLQP